MAYRVDVVSAIQRLLLYISIGNLVWDFMFSIIQSIKRGSTVYIISY